MVCNGAEQVGGVGEGGAHGGANNGVGDAAPLVTGQGRAGQQPGQAEQGLKAYGDKPDGFSDARACCQRAACGNAHQVGRHDHGHRCQRVAALGCRYGVAESGGGLRAV